MVKTPPSRTKLGRLEESVRDQLQPPQISLQNYGGGRLNIVCQVAVTIARDKFTTTTTVYFQKKVPLKLLLGTDVQASLGLSVILTTGENAVNLLSGIEVPCSSSVAKVDRHGRTIY